jgi:hypothetical protein
VSSDPEVPDFETPGLPVHPAPGSAWVTAAGLPLPALQRLAATFHDGLRTLPDEWSAGVLTVGLFVTSDADTVHVVPRAHLLTPLPTGDQRFDLLVWDEFAPEEVLDPAVEECGRIDSASLLLVHIHSPVGGGAGAQIRLRVGTAPGLTRSMLDDPVWLSRLVRDPAAVFA